MFIEPARHLGFSPFMGDKAKSEHFAPNGASNLIRGCSIDISPLRGSFRQTMV